jgi:hypothetical protein
MSSFAAWRRPGLGRWLVVIGAGLGLSACHHSGPTTTPAANTPVPALVIIPDPGCSPDWPHASAVTGPLSSTVVACSNAAGTAVQLTNDGSTVVGIQVEDGSPQFSDPEQISPVELTIYEAVMSVIPQDGNGVRGAGRFHVLLPRRSVVVTTNGAPYHLSLTRGTTEIAAAYAAQTVAGWAYSKAFPTQALVQDLQQCAAGIGSMYSKYVSAGLRPDITSVIHEGFQYVWPCVQSIRTMNAAPAVQAGEDVANSASEKLATLDDALPAPLPQAAPVAVEDPTGAAEIAALEDSSKIAQAGLLTDLGEVVKLATEVH